MVRQDAVMNTSRSGSEDNLETRFYRDSVDPWVRRVVAAEDPWQSYEMAIRAAGAVAEDMTRLPHGGAVYTQWMGLSDLFDAPGLDHVAPQDAQRVLRVAAEYWLAGEDDRARNHWSRWCETDFWRATWPGRPLRLD